MDEDAFSVMVLALFLFHLGLELPGGPPSSPRAFEIEDFETGYELGKKCQVDLRSWAFWPHMERPLDEVRRELGLPG